MMLPGCRLAYFYTVIHFAQQRREERLALPFPFPVRNAYFLCLLLGGGNDVLGSLGLSLVVRALLPSLPQEPTPAE